MKPICSMLRTGDGAVAVPPFGPFARSVCKPLTFDVSPVEQGMLGQMDGWC